MIYGTLTLAQEYSQKGQQKEWLQLFLRNDGKNLAFADGLLKEQRYYIGPVKIPLEILHFDTGTPKYLTEPNDIEWFYQVVDRMMKAYQDNWDVPPLIVNYHEGRFEVNDGRHRYVCFLSAYHMK